MSRAAIDIGSNSLLLTIVDDDEQIVHDEARVVGLGRGLGDRGLFDKERMEAAEQVLSEYLDIARAHGVEAWRIKAVATSAARRALNAPTWVGRLQHKLSLRVRIIPGEEEARLTWLGAFRDLAVPPGPTLVIDVGGGSTELVQGEAGEVRQRVSLEVGSVRLTEQFLGTDRVEPESLGHLLHEVDYALHRVTLDPPPATVVGVAGTVTTLAAMRLGLEHYDSAVVHGSTLSRDDLARFTDLLLPASPEERRELARVAPKRADFLLAGAAILDKVLAASGTSEMRVSDRGLRFGLLTPKA